jgi:type I restriction enzyme S subunit
MSEYPSGWRVETIGDICDIHDSKRIPLSSEQRRDRKGPYPYYGANNIQDSIDDFIFDFDAVLLAEDGGYYDEYETRDIAQYATGRYWVNNHAHILTGRKCLDTRFLYFTLVRKNICPWINTGTRAKLNQADLRQIEIAVPPLPEQKKIAEILSGIDNTSARLSKKLHKIVNLKESVETTLFKRHPNETSGECRWVRLEDIATFSQGVQVGVENHFSRKDGGQVRFVRISDYTRTREEPRFIDQKYAVKGLVARDDVVMIRYGEAGRVCRGIEGAIANNLFTITPNKGISKDYLYCYLACNQVQKNIAKISASSAMPAINFLQLGGIEFKLVDECSQAKSVSQINSLENKINLLVSQINRLSDLSLAVGSDLLSGRKRVSV